MRQNSYPKEGMRRHGERPRVHDDTHTTQSRRGGGRRGEKGLGQTRPDRTRHGTRAVGPGLGSEGRPRPARKAHRGEDRTRRGRGATEPQVRESPSTPPHKRGGGPEETTPSPQRVPEPRVRLTGPERTADTAPRNAQPDTTTRRTGADPGESGRHRDGPFAPRQARRHVRRRSVEHTTTRRERGARDRDVDAPSRDLPPPPNSPPGLAFTEGKRRGEVRSGEGEEGGSPGGARGGPGEGGRAGGGGGPRPAVPQFGARAAGGGLDRRHDFGRGRRQERDGGAGLGRGARGRGGPYTRGPGREGGRPPPRAGEGEGGGPRPVVLRPGPPGLCPQAGSPMPLRRRRRRRPRRPWPWARPRPRRRRYRNRRQPPPPEPPPGPPSRDGVGGGRDRRSTGRDPGAAASQTM